MWTNVHVTFISHHVTQVETFLSFTIFLKKTGKPLLDSWNIKISKIIVSFAERSGLLVIHVIYLHFWSSDALAKCLPLRRWWRQVDSIIVTASAASSAPSPWTPPVCVMVLTTRSTAESATGSCEEAPNQSSLMKPMCQLTLLEPRMERRPVRDVLEW